MIHGKHLLGAFIVKAEAYPLSQPLYHKGRIEAEVAASETLSIHGCAELTFKSYLHHFPDIIREILTK